MQENFRTAFGQPLVVGDHDAAVAGRHVLGVFEAETGHVSDRAGQPSLVLAEETLGGVFDHRQMVFLGQRHDGVHVAGQPVQVHRHDRLGPRRNSPLHVLRIHVKRVGIDVGEDGHGVLVQGHRGVGDHGQGRRNHLVARPHSRRRQATVQGRSSRVVRDRIANPETLGKGLFQPRVHRAVGRGAQAGIENFFDVHEFFFAKPPRLLGHRIGPCVTGVLHRGALAALIILGKQLLRSHPFR